jgi:hypothetical protein
MSGEGWYYVFQVKVKSLSVLVIAKFLAWLQSKLPTFRSVIFIMKNHLKHLFKEEKTMAINLEKGQKSICKKQMVAAYNKFFWV